MFDADCWPFVVWDEEHKIKIETNVPIFERAGRMGNLEANIKLGVACLYGEGLDSSADTAYEMLNRAEEMVGSSSSFAWLLFRPPWSSEGCSKATIYRQMKATAEEGMHNWNKKLSGILFCVAKTLSLQLDNQAENNKAAEEWFKFAAEKGCGDAACELYQLRKKRATSYDQGSRVEAVRFLREHNSGDSWNVQVALASEYAAGNYAGIDAREAMHFFRGIVQQHVGAVPQRGELKMQREEDPVKYAKMRYILVDWLVEVADLKSFSRNTLYMTVSLVDRYLDRYRVTRKTLQLLGISCMVIAARFIEAEVITIREAAWLTDNTYQYEQVVRKMGSALCAAGGKLRCPTSVDFLRLYVTLGGADRDQEELLHYTSELAMLHIPVGKFAAPMMAAAVYFLTGLSTKLPMDQWWPKRVEKWTGIAVEDMVPCICAIQKACFVEDAVRDHREAPLKAVVDRYNRRTTKSLEESNYALPNYEALEDQLRTIGAIPDAAEMELEPELLVDAGSVRDASAQAAPLGCISNTMPMDVAASAAVKAPMPTVAADSRAQQTPVTDMADGGFIPFTRGSENGH